MSYWHEQALAGVRRSELAREAGVRRAAAAQRLASAQRATRDAAGPTRPNVQQRLGLLLVEAGLHLITRRSRRRLSPLA